MELTDAQREVLVSRLLPNGRLLNIFGTVGRNPVAAKAGFRMST